jgi:hypothetical protein
MYVICIKSKQKKIFMNLICKVVKVILIKNTILQRIEQLNPIECNYIRN